MTAARARVLVYGYGNPGRLDDGLGPAFADALAQLCLEGVDVDANYQLSLEDAAACAEHDVVIFVDADTGGREPFWFDRVAPRQDGVGFSSHSVSPEALLALATDLMGGAMAGYVLGIRGYEFNGFGEVLSARARRNLEAAVAFARELLATGEFDEYTTPRESEDEAAHRPAELAGGEVSR